jgi:flagellar biosynthesis/type III secretory pathway protein FliH
MRPIPIAQYLEQFGRVSVSERQVARPEPMAVASRPLAAPQDRGESLEEAFERGRREGAAAARKEAERAYAKESAERDERARAERIAFGAAEYTRLHDKIAYGLLEIEANIARSVASILKPYLAEAQSNQILQSLSHQLRQILSGGDEVMKIVGPKDMLEALKDKLSGCAASVEYVVSDGVDVRITLQQTLIETRLASWAEQILAPGD